MMEGLGFSSLIRAGVSAAGICIGIETNKRFMYNSQARLGEEPATLDSPLPDECLNKGYRVIGAQERTGLLVTESSPLPSQVAPSHTWAEKAELCDLVMRRDLFPL